MKPPSPVCPLQTPTFAPRTCPHHLLALATPLRLIVPVGVVLAFSAFYQPDILLIMQLVADREPQFIDKNCPTMDPISENSPLRISPKRKRDDIEPAPSRFSPQLSLNPKYPIPSQETGEGSPRSAIAHQLQAFRIRDGASHVSFGEVAETPSLAKRFKPTYDVKRQPRVRHTPVFRRRPSNSDIPQRHRRSSSAPPPSERLECLLVSNGALANEHHRPLDPTPIVSPLSRYSSPHHSALAASPSLAASLAKSATTSPIPSPRSLLLPPTPSIATDTLRPTTRSPPPRRPPPIAISQWSPTFTITASPTSNSATSSAAASSPKLLDQTTSRSHPNHPYTHLPVPFSPTSPLSPTALTWKPAEITGHILSSTLDTPDDDGYGLHGIGFKPSPQLALARQMRRRQQVMEWRAREAREARMARWRKRDGTGNASGVEGVTEVGGGEMKRVVRFA